MQTKVFTASCTFSTCHTIAGGGAGGLQLEPTVAYKQLVGAAATVGTHTRVIPNDLTGSYLIEKLTKAAPAAGARMPLGGDPVDPTQLKLVQDWISAGAKND